MLVKGHFDDAWQDRVNEALQLVLSADFYYALAQVVAKLVDRCSGEEREHLLKQCAGEW